MQTSAGFSIPKLPSIWVVLGNSWDQKDFLVTSGVKMSMETRIFLSVVTIFSVLFFSTGHLPVPLGIPVSIIMGWVVVQGDAAP